MKSRWLTAKGTWYATPTTKENQNCSSPLTACTLDNAVEQVGTNEISLMVGL